MKLRIGSNGLNSLNNLVKYLEVSGGEDVEAGVYAIQANTSYS